jgi:hypothetical protein
VGPACQWQCRAAPSPDWLLWAAVSERAGWLKSRSDSVVQTVAVRTHAQAPDRAAARTRPAPRAASRSRCVSTATVRRCALARSEADAVAPEPSTPPSTPSRPPVSRASDRANALTRPRSSPPIVTEPTCRRHPRSLCHPTPPSTPSCCVVAHASVSHATSWAARAAPTEDELGCARVAVGRVRWPHQHRERGPRPRGRGPYARTVQLGRARFRSSDTRISFSIF